MKIIVTSIGTRGDMEPFLALGEILQKEGHQIICLFPEQFRPLAEDCGFEFASLGSEFLEMLDSPAGRIAMGGGGMSFKKFFAYLKLIKMQSSVQKAMVRKQMEVIEEEKPDRIVHNGKVVYPIIWSLRNIGLTTVISPVPYLHYVKDHAHVAFNRNLGPFLNKLTYKLANFGLVKTIMSSVKQLGVKKPDGSKIKQADIQGSLFGNKAIYTISPSLFERPDYWDKKLQVLGYHERTKTNHWQASPELEIFISQHPRLIMVTFGSMINDAPKEKTALILEVLESLKVPAIINTASGGLVKPLNYNRDLFFFTESIPYDYICPKLYAMIHHGGSGTTHTALKYGCATLIIPHIIDQYVWNSLINKKQLGPLGKDISEISKKQLTQSISDLINNKTFKSNAEKIGSAIKNENFTKDIVNFILEKA